MRRRQACRERLLDHAEPLIGVEEGVGTGQDPDMLGDGAGHHAEEDQRAGRPVGRKSTSIIIRRAPSASTSRGPVSPQSRL
jgi:hypothetical protein